VETVVLICGKRSLYPSHIMDLTLQCFINLPLATCASDLCDCQSWPTLAADHCYGLMSWRVPQK